MSQNNKEAVQTYETVTKTVEAIQSAKSNLQEVITSLIEAETDFSLKGGDLWVDDTKVDENNWIVWSDSDTVRVVTDKSFRYQYEV